VRQSEGGPHAVSRREGATDRRRPLGLPRREWQG